MDDAMVDRAVGVLALLANPTRLRILAILADGEANGVAPQGRLDLAQNLISYHMALLCRGGLVRTRQAGRRCWRPSGRSSARPDILLPAAEDRGHPDVGSSGVTRPAVGNPWRGVPHDAVNGHRS